MRGRESVHVFGGDGETDGVDSRSLADANPFSSRFVRPGAISFRFPDNLDSESLVGKLSQHRWWGQITGPHGSGKSTLVHALMPCLRRATRNVHWFTLNNQTRVMPVTREIVGQWEESSQVIVDGYEQLSWRNRRWLKRRCRRSGCGLLVTSHRPAGFPNLYHTCISLPHVRDIVKRLLPESSDAISQHDMENAFERHRGNLREILFELYDIYERRRHGYP